MSDLFDPYHKWLGIPPQEQPPNLYRLLALPLFESDPEVIECAADQRMGHIRTYQAGRYSAESQRILNELSAARVCLLSAERKAAYDAQLRAQLSPPAPPEDAAVLQILPSPPPPIRGGPLPPAVATGHAVEPPPTAVASERSAPPHATAAVPLAPPPPSVIPARTLPSRVSRSPVVPIALGFTLLLFGLAGLWIWNANQTPTAPRLAFDRPAAARATSEPGSANGATPADKGDGGAAENPPTAATGSVPPAVPGPPEPVASAQPVEPNPSEPKTPPTIAAADTQSPAPVDAAAQAPPQDAGNAAGQPPAPQPIPPGREDHAAPPDSNPAAGEPAGQSAATEPDEKTPDKDRSHESASKKPPRKARVPSAAVLRKAQVQLQNVLAVGTFTQLLAEAQLPDRSIAEAYVLLEQARIAAIRAADVDQAVQAVDLIGTRFAGDAAQLLRMTCVDLQQTATGPSQAQTVAMAALRLSQEAQRKDEADRARLLAEFAGTMARISGDQQTIDAVRTHFLQLKK